MALKACMNGLCGSTSSIQWKKGWGLRSGGSAILCDKCGSAYEQSIFCDTFHLKETGWRKCNSCSRRLHCGCIASKSFLELLDNGGVECISCARSPRPSSIPRDEEPNGCSTSAEDNGLRQSTSLDNKKHMPQIIDTNGLTVQINREQTLPPADVVRGTRGSNLTQPHTSSSQIANGKKPMGLKIMYDPIAQTSLNMAFGASSGTPDIPQRVPGVPGETKETSMHASSFKQGQNSRQPLLKPLKICPGSGSGSGSGTSKDVFLQPQVRVARPPVEGRGKNQLLPRYWPRITDQELQQISVDSNSTVVPLFEKILSASDAGRIGRLVLPKACAEAYFPPISQPEGLPLRIQDVKGNEWVFQFRFWPNNNSRMYVLEGVTPCIQAMQLVAGDTVIFSRKDPEEKLIMGFRKTSNFAVKQHTQISAIPNGTITNGPFFSGAIEKLPGGYTGRLQSLKGSTGLHVNAQTGQSDSTKGNSSWCKTENHGAWASESSTMQSLLVPEKKRSRIIGSKSKRLVVDNEDAVEMKVTWEEAQHMLRPPPSVKPSIVIVEGYEFEEYEEPPVFGKKTIFTAQSHGGKNQWAQCDSCSRWRKLPADVLLPPNWTCADNAWDPQRCSCSAPDEMSAKDLEHFLRTNIDTEKWSLTRHKSAQERDRSALDELATIAVLGDNRNDCSIPPVGTTTKHPRHRPGCTCIVCIQPPSGKGTKHLPTCKCNVCMTVKRRFETLMMRKKKRQELEEIAQRNPQICYSKDEAEQESASKRKVLLPQVHTESEAGPSNGSDSGSQNKILSETSKGQIDLNCDPGRDEDFQAGSSQLQRSMMGLLQVASRPLETYLKQNGLESLACEPQPSSSSHVLQQATENGEGKPPDKAQVPLVQEHENDKNEGNSMPDQTQNDTV